MVGGWADVWSNSGVAANGGNMQGRSTRDMPVKGTLPNWHWHNQQTAGTGPVACRSLMRSLLALPLPRFTQHF